MIVFLDGLVFLVFHWLYMLFDNPETPTHFCSAFSQDGKPFIYSVNYIHTDYSILCNPTKSK